MRIKATVYTSYQGKTRESFIAELESYKLAFIERAGTEVTITVPTGTTAMWNARRLFQDWADASNASVLVYVGASPVYSFNPAIIYHGELDHIGNPVDEVVEDIYWDYIV